MSLEVDVMDALVAAGLGTKGTDLWAGPMRDQEGDPDALITVLATGGTTPQPDLTGPSGNDFRQRRVQIRVRSSTEDYEAARAKANAVFAAVHKQAPAGYVGWLCDEAVYLGLDERGRHELSLNLTVMTYN